MNESLKTCLKTAIILFYIILLTYQSQVFRRISFKFMHRNYIPSGNFFRTAGLGFSTKHWMAFSSSSRQLNYSTNNSQNSKQTKPTNTLVPIALGLTFIATYQLYKISKREDDPVHTHTGPLYLR